MMSALQYIIRQQVQDVPEDVRIQTERKTYYEKKLIRRERDEDVQPIREEDPSVTEEWLKQTCRQKCL